jgi:cell division transport system permease protein
MRLYKKKQLGSYPYITVVFTITVALLVLGLFAILLLHATRLTKVIKENVEVQVFLHKNLNDNEIVRIGKQLSAKPYTDITDGQPQVRFISKDEAAQEFIKDTGENFVKFLGDNPLRDAYTIKIKEEYVEADKLKIIKKEIAEIEGVFEVVYVEALVEAINKNLTKVSIVLLTFAAILLITVIILINNVIKLALFSQRFLIRSMQLVGATAWFIQRPFVLRAGLHGFISGVIASGLLYAGLQYATRQLPELSRIQETDKIFILLLALIFIGTLIGALSAKRSVGKYTRLSLDELY